MLQLEAFQARALSRKKRDVIVGLDLDLPRAPGLTGSLRRRLLELCLLLRRGRRFADRRRRRLRRLLVALLVDLRRWRRRKEVRDVERVADEYQEGESDRYERAFCHESFLRERRALIAVALS